MAFKAKGQWIMAFDFGQNGGFTGGNGLTGSRYGGTDEFDVMQRVRLQLEAVASEALSGTVHFEMGNNIWGKSAGAGATNNNGGSPLGGDQTNTIELKWAYLDWMIPQTDLKLRMGLQAMALPSFVTNGDASVFNDDVAGIVANYKFNDNVSLTALWARPFNDNYTTNYGGRTAYANYMDNVDAFALVLPLTFDGVKATPWALYAAIGPNAFKDGTGEFGNLGISNVGTSYVLGGMVPVGGSRHKDGSNATKRLSSYAEAWWAGLTGEVTVLDPFRIAWDFKYGSVRWDDSRLNRQGWLASLLFEYKLDWAVPGLYAWYASGDDSNPANGSERMPSFDANGSTNDLSSFAFNGNPYIPPRENVLSRNMTGTWGIGARLKNVSFVEDLKHTLRLTYIGGTNSTTMAKYITGRKGPGWSTNPAIIAGPNAGLAGMDPLYMTTQDHALEVGLTTRYQMYENFLVYMDASYIATWLDHSRSVWGLSQMNGRSDQQRDPWNISLQFVYSF
ncbi:MAG: outer membrane homotrimeric porin [Desulfovibrio sp.]|nr:outer membrane homotrimeric porin [Desulfovibrio sp.]